MTEALTFLFTDIEGSTRKAHELGDSWFDVLEAHHAVLRPVFAAHGGVEVSTAGDSFFVVFEDAAGAVAATIAMQRALAAHDWTPHPPVRVRMGLHTGPARFRAHDNDYAGLTVHAASRVESAAAGAQVLITQATLDAASNAWPDGVEVIDLGPHRLKDLPAELQLYQLAAEGLPREFPPVRGLDVARNNIPVPPSSFVGRTEVLARLHQLLDDDRIVTLVGAGGTGKTRVALRLATERLPRHADGVWFVELAAATSRDRIVSAISEALGFKEENDQEPLALLLDSLRDKSVLLLIDNCEHVIDDAASVIDQLLAVGHGVRVLATSREPLEIEGERVWPLLPLATDDEDGGEAVELLADRIALVQPDFALTPELRRAAIDVARRLDGLPLALELAAAAMLTLTLPEIAEQMDARFEVLTKGRRTAAERQKTLWGAIDWSYSLLSPDEQRLFRSLGVFPAEFDFGVVERVCGADSDDTLFALQRKSLVAESPSTRFRYLESIRAYARDQLAAHGELETIREQHARAFTQIARDATNEWIDAIHEDLLEARRWGREHDPDVEIDTTLSLQPFWIRKGRWREGRVASDETLASTIDASADKRQRLTSNAGQIALSQGDASAARTRFTEAADIAYVVNGDEGRTMVLGDLGDIAAREGDLQTAAALYNDALAAARRTDTRAVVATCLAHLAQIASQEGDLTRAWNLGVEAIEEARIVELADVEFAVNNLLGVIAMQRGELDDARQTFTDALALARKFDLVQPQAYLLFCLATVALGAGRASDAVPHLREALPLALEIGADADVVESLEGVVRTAVALNQPAAAASLLATADAERERIGFARDPSSAAIYAVLVAELGAAPALPVGDAVSAALGLLDDLQSSSTEGSGQT